MHAPPRLLNSPAAHSVIVGATGARSSSDVPPGEWTLHLTDVTEGAAALQLPAVPPVVIPLTVAAPPPEEEEEY